MKKITLSLVLTLFGIAAGIAQTGFQTIINDGFESSTATTAPYANGFPAAFLAQKQTIWTTTSATNNATPSTTAVWKQIYSNNATAANKDYKVAIVQEEGAGISSNTQCLKFYITENSLNNGTAAYTLRIQSLDNIISFASGETTSKYEAKFWARTDGATRKMILNGTADTLSISSTWTQYTLSRYVTGTSATSLAIDFCRQADKADYVVYIDGFTLAQKPVMTMKPASAISTNGFTANWTAISGTTSYRLSVQTSADGGNSWTSATNAITITDAATTSYAISGLNPNSLYQYRVIATDGLTTTAYPAWVQVTTNSVTTDLNKITDTSVFTQNNSIFISATIGCPVSIYTITGQLKAQFTANDQMISYQAPSAGIYIVKAGEKTFKVIL